MKKFEAVWKVLTSLASLGLVLLIAWYSGKYFYFGHNIKDAMEAILLAIFLFMGEFVDIKRKLKI